MKRFKYHIPCKSVWVVTTDAKDEKEARGKLRRRQYIRHYEYEGDTPSGKTELVDVQTINKGEMR